MAKLRDMTVNIVPKLDVRKANEMGKKLARIMGSATDMFKTGKFFASKATVAINQGSHLLDKISNILNKPRGSLQEAMDVGDVIADTAERIGSTPARLMQVLTTLFEGGAGMNSTLELIKKFAAKAPHLGIQGDLDDAFVGVLREIGTKKGKERQELINKYFGAGTGLLAKDAIVAAGDWFNLRTSVESNQVYGAAVTSAEAATSAANDITFKSRLDRLLAAHEEDLFNAELQVRQEEEQAKTKLLSNVDKNSFVSLNHSVTKITNGVDVLVQTVGNFGVKLVDAVGIFNRIGDALTGLQGAIQSLKFWGKNK